jgi:hypothetical protein
VYVQKKWSWSFSALEATFSVSPALTVKLLFAGWREGTVAVVTDDLIVWEV